MGAASSLGRTPPVEVGESLEATVLTLWRPAPGDEHASFAAALRAAEGMPRLVAAVSGGGNAAAVAEGLLAPRAASQPARGRAVAQLVPTETEAASAEAAVFVAMRAAALARAGLRVSPAAFLRASLVRLRVEAVEAAADAPPPCFAGLPSPAIAAAIELGRFRFRFDRSAATASSGGEDGGNSAASAVHAGVSVSASFAGASGAPHSAAAADATDVSDVFLTAAIVESERDFRLLAGGKGGRGVTPEAFLRRFLPGAGIGAAALAQAWDDVSLCFFLCDLDDDGHLDGIEFAAARWVLSFFAARGGHVSDNFTRRPVLPLALVHETKRALAAKREMSIKRVRGVSICARAGDDAADAMRTKLERILLDRKYVLCEGSGTAAAASVGAGAGTAMARSASGGAGAGAAYQAVIVLFTPHFLDRCVDGEGDAMYRQLRDATRNPSMVIVPVFDPAYWAVDYLKVPAQRRLLRRSTGGSVTGAADVEEIMTRLRVQKGVELNDSHLGAVGRILHNLLQGRELSMEEE